jgi:predicted MFS family arabinose efflux permease
MRRRILEHPSEFVSFTEFRPKDRPPKRGPLIALRNRNFRLYLLGLFLSLAGTYMQIVAEGWLIYQLTDSAFSLGLVGFITMLPLGPWALVAGVLIDRLPRKKLLVIIQVLQILPPLWLAFMTWSGQVQLWHIILVNFVLGACMVVDSPTRQAIIVDTVEPEILSSAVAITSSGFNVARVIGPAIGGLVIRYVGIEFAFLLNGLSFLAVVVALLKLQVRSGVKSDRPSSLKHDLLEGWRYLLGERTIMGLIVLISLVSVFVLPYQTLMPVFARDVLRTGATGLGMLTAAAGIGAIIGALAVHSQANLASHLRNLEAIGLVIAAALFTYVFATSSNPLLSAFMIVLISGSVVGLKTLGITVIHLQVRDELRGRVISVVTLMMGAAPRLGGLMLGYVASIRTAPISLGLGAIACLVCGVLALVMITPLSNSTAFSHSWWKETFRFGRDKMSKSRGSE